MADSWYSIIRSIGAESGFVLLRLKGRRDVTLSVEEALDRAIAIEKLTTENTITHRTTKELYTALMEAALAARQQQASMLREGLYVDFALKQNQLRHVELYKVQRAIRG